jgi:hypothetical protein
MSSSSTPGILNSSAPAANASRYTSALSDVNDKISAEIKNVGECRRSGVEHFRAGRRSGASAAGLRSCRI